jgi:hypothetical protein
MNIELTLKSIIHSKEYLTEEEKQLLIDIDERIYQVESVDRHKQYGEDAREVWEEYQRTKDYDQFYENAHNLNGFGVDDIPWLIKL